MSDGDGVWLSIRRTRPPLWTRQATASVSLVPQLGSLSTTSLQSQTADPGRVWGGIVTNNPLARVGAGGAGAGAGAGARVCGAPCEAEGGAQRRGVQTVPPSLARPLRSLGGLGPRPGGVGALAPHALRLVTIKVNYNYLEAR